MLINDKYMIFSVIGKGAFGIVCKSINIDTQEYLAIKFESKDNSKNRLEKEYKIYTFLNENNTNINIPKIYWYGEYKDCNILIMDKLGESLENIIKKLKYCFDLRSILLLTIKTINLLKDIHSFHIIHQDIKPDNIAFGRNKFKNEVFLFDFGLSRLKEDDEIEKVNKNTGLVGTLRYASINSHLGNNLSYRDDLESLLYSIIYLYNRKLPWQSIKCEDKKQKNELVLEMKKNIELSQLCYKLPFEYQQLFKYCKNLKFNEIPKYNNIIKILYNKYIEYGLETNETIPINSDSTNNNSSSGDLLTYNFNYSHNKNNISEKNNKSLLLKKTIKMLKNNNI
jgi:serine/threonine protein kinase